MPHQEAGATLDAGVSGLAHGDKGRPALGPYLLAILDDMKRVLVERGASYADIADNSQAFTDILVGMKITMPDGASPVDIHCLCNIATKLARMATGSRAHEDNWVDIANYAVLALADLRRRKDTTEVGKLNTQTRG